jgi:hypothetical protein
MEMWSRERIRLRRWRPSGIGSTVQDSYVANVLGNPLAVRAMMTCNKGATVQGEAAAATPGVYTSGVAQDSNGNLYKLGF